MTISEGRAKQIVKVAHNSLAGNNVDEVQTLTISEGRAKQIVKVAHNSLAGNNVDEVQTLTISEGRAKQIVKVAHNSLAGNNVDEVQTLTISEGRAKQIVKVAHNSLAGNNVDEVQTLTISEGRAKQIVKVAHNSLAGNNVDEVQTLTILETFNKQILVVSAETEIQSGSYIMAYKGQSTTCIHHNASTSDLQSALEALTTITSVTISMTTSDNTRTYSIEFSGSGIEALTIASVGTGTCDTFVCGNTACSTHNIELSHADGIGTFDGGQHFTLSFGGCPLCPSTSSETTGNIDWTQDTDGQTNTNSLQSRLNALSNIASSASDTGSLGVVVTRSNINNATNEGYVFSVTFSGSYVAGNVPLLSLQNNFLEVKTQVMAQSPL